MPAEIWRSCGVNDTGEILLDLRNWSLVRETPTGPVNLLCDIDFTLRRGEWVGLLGANGSGKTSLLRYLAGEESPLIVPTGLVFQDPDEQIVAATVAEELGLGRPGLAVEPWLSFYGLQHLAELDPRLLSAGQKQRLTMAVAEAGQPQVLLCDEPTTLQDAVQADWLLARIKSWRRRTGGTVIFATQSPQEAALCDRLLVLNRGTIAATGPPSDLLRRSDVLALLRWPGEEAGADPVPAAAAGADPPSTGLGAAPGERPAAEWRGVGHRFAHQDRLFAGVDLSIRAGWRIGITGKTGCGKSTLLTLAAGLRAPSEGSCYLQGRPLCRERRTDLDHGLALLAPQFPEYLFTRSTVAAEISLDPGLSDPGVAGVLDAAGLPLAFARRNPHELSSGEKRRLAMAMVILSGRPLLLLDEPAAGLDWEGRGRIVRLLEKLPAAAAVVIASSDRDFLRACGCAIHRLDPDGLRALDRS